MKKPEISYYKASWNFNNYLEEDLNKIKTDWITYIDFKYCVGYSEVNTCVIKHNSTQTFFEHFQIDKKHAYMWNKKSEDVIDCKITIIEDHILLTDKYKSGYDENCIDYFGWISYHDNDDDNIGIKLIQPNIKCFSIQFPGAGDNESKQKLGKIVRLKVELI